MKLELDILKIIDDRAPKKRFYEVAKNNVFGIKNEGYTLIF